MKYIVFCIIFVLAGCVFVIPEEKTPKDCVNPEGPWYSPQFLEEHPQYGADMLCSNYYKYHDNATKHTVPIICGPYDGQCGITACDCVCHR